MKHQTSWSLLGAVFLLTVGWMAYRLATSRPTPEAFDPEWSVADLAARLQERLPGLHVVSQRADGDFRTGVYLCTCARQREELGWLRRNPEWATHWTGVVFCERLAPQSVVDTEGWDDNGLRAGPFLFFGDAALIVRIRDALR